VTSNRLASLRKKAASRSGSAARRKRMPRARAARNSSTKRKTRRKPIGMMISSGFRKPENSPISMVARSQKLQKKARVKRTKPATRERGRRRAAACETSGLIRPESPKSRRKTPAMNPAV
jgi:hypothetical protein